VDQKDMMTKSIDDDLLALMIKHEESISGLYDEFRKAIPGMEAFWRQLVQDEKAHAQVLRDLAARLVRKDVLLTNRPFPREAILAAIPISSARQVKSRKLGHPRRKPSQQPSTSKGRCWKRTSSPSLNPTPRI
jgi:hypothetical protein